MYVPNAISSFVVKVPFVSVLLIKLNFIYSICCAAASFALVKPVIEAGQYIGN